MRFKKYGVFLAQILAPNSIGAHYLSELHQLCELGLIGQEFFFKRYSKLKNVLIITRNLPPLIGGMERLIWHIVDALHEHFRVIVIGPDGCSSFLPNTLKVKEIPFNPLWKFLIFSYIYARKLAKIYRPEIVFCGSGLTAPIGYFVAKLVNAQKIVYLHGLDVEASDFFYQRLWPPFFKRMNKILVNSNFTRNLVLSRGVPDKNIVILHPGVSLPNLDKKEEASNAFRERYGLVNDPIMLYVGRITPRKGLSIFVEKILPEIAHKYKKAKLVVIGDEPKAALAKIGGELEKIRKTLELKGLEDRVLFLGSRPQDHPELSEAYFAADVLVFPVQERPGDNEGFGMVAIEAAAHGTPTVAFKAGGVTDAVKDGVSGFLVETGDYTIFAKRVVKILESPKVLDQNQMKNFVRHFSWDRFYSTLEKYFLS